MSFKVTIFFILYGATFKEENILSMKSIFLGNNCIQNFHLGRYIGGYTVEKLSFTATHERSRKM